MEWNDIEDGKPEFGKSVFVLDNYKKIASIGFLKTSCHKGGDDFYWVTMHDSIYNNYIVTHFCYIPETPSGAAAE